MSKLTKEISLKNLSKKKTRTILMIVLISFLSMSLFLGIIIVRSLQNGLKNYEERLGADVIVVPYEATTKSTFDDILLEGITSNYYFKEAYYNKIKNIDGIDKISYQFYLTSAKASCCSSRVQIIGFDPETDFSIQPWIQKSYNKEIAFGDLVVGANINVPESMKIKFYGNDYKVVAQLAKTGTGLDSAVYGNIDTVKYMAESSNALAYNEELASIDISKSMSCVFIKVKDGVDPDSLAAAINSSVHGIKASSSATMVNNISKGLNSVSSVIGVLIIVVWVLASIILIITFILITNERKKEFAILRILGASRKMISKVIISESLIISSISSLIGLLVSIIILIPLSGNLQNIFDLPFLMPNIINMIIYAIITIIFTILVCTLSSLKSSYDISKDDAALLMKEE